MISFDFEYYMPDSIREAVELYQRLHEQGKEPLYYGGGTEILSLARLNLVRTGAVIDLKGIPECQTLSHDHGLLVFGAGVPLTQVVESHLFPLLSENARHASDFTTRNKITLGGNICGQIFYREAVLPFLLSDSFAVTAGPKGIRRFPIHTLFHRTLQLQKGEFLVQMLTDPTAASLPYYHVKKTKIEKIDYPLVTLSALKQGDRICVALSGVCAFPFRSLAIEEALNEQKLTWEVRIENAIRQLPAPFLDDIRGSADYRAFVLQNAFYETLDALEGVHV